MRVGGRSQVVSLLGPYFYASFVVFGNGYGRCEQCGEGVGTEFVCAYDL